ncbi:MAG: hypothetical protein RDV48_25405 [Candidatus Eremiobacteraeota bacterium]|nr:hypothetical protein [Candidatus Eremiobacteraeota bacterium]
MAYRLFARAVIVIALLLSAASHGASAEEKAAGRDDPVKITVGTWEEYFRNSSRTLDYSFSYCRSY